MKKVYLWGYWSRNFGDDLFLKIYQNKMSPYNVQSYILTSKKNKTYYESMGFAVICSDSLIYRILYKFLVVCGLPELYFLLVTKKSLFVMLGGSLFAENKGALAEKRQIKNLSYAVKKAEKTFVIGSNFGPYNSTAFYNDYKLLFSEIEDVCFRDKKSYDMFKMVVPSVRYAPDIAFEGDWKKQIFPSCNKVVISVIDLNQREGLSEYCNKYEDIISEIAGLHLDQGEEIVLLSLCKEEGDLSACNRIAERIYSKFNKTVEVINYDSIDEVIHIISIAKKIYATRFHALMISLYFRKNVVPLIYSDKAINAIESYCESFSWFKISDMVETKLEDIYHTNQQPELNLLGESQFQRLVYHLEAKSGEKR